MFVKKMKKLRVLGVKKKDRCSVVVRLKIYAFVHLLYERCGFISIHNTYMRETTVVVQEISPYFAAKHQTTLIIDEF